MVTHSMLNTAWRRGEWKRLFSNEVDRYCLDPTHDPIDWSSALRYWRDGYDCITAARKYCEAHHIGVNH